MSRAKKKSKHPGNRKTIYIQLSPLQRIIGILDMVSNFLSIVAAIMSFIVACTPHKILIKHKEELLYTILAIYTLPVLMGLFREWTEISFMLSSSHRKFSLDVESIYENVIRIIFLPLLTWLVLRENSKAADIILRIILVLLSLTELRDRFVAIILRFFD